MVLSSAVVIQAVIMLLLFLLAITVHECCHAWAAYLLGDNTARNAGRLTLNPLAHIDPMGLLFLLLFRIGWARPVPMDPRNFTYPRFYAVLTGLAGPASNFVLAILFFIIMRVVGAQNLLALTFLQMGAYINVMLGTFNLLPIPPLDGSHLLQALIPAQYQIYYYRFVRYALIILLLLLVAVPQFQLALAGLIQTVYRFLAGLIL